MSKKTIKLKLEVMLKKKGITKYKFAQMLGKPTSDVARYFRKNYKPALTTLEKWAEVLGCKVTDLIEG